MSLLSSFTWGLVTDKSKTPDLADRLAEALRSLDFLLSLDFEREDRREAASGCTETERTERLLLRRLLDLLLVSDLLRFFDETTERLLDAARVADLERLLLSFMRPSVKPFAPLRRFRRLRVRSRKKNPR